MARELNGTKTHVSDVSGEWRGNGLWQCHDGIRGCINFWRHRMMTWHCLVKGGPFPEVEQHHIRCWKLELREVTMILTEDVEIIQLSSLMPWPFMSCKKSGSWLYNLKCVTKCEASLRYKCYKECNMLQIFFFFETALKHAYTPSLLLAQLHAALLQISCQISHIS